MRISAISEVIGYLNTDDCLDRDSDEVAVMIQFLHKVFSLVQKSNDGDELSQDMMDNLSFYHSKLLMIQLNIYQFLYIHLQNHL